MRGGKDSGRLPVLVLWHLINHPIDLGGSQPGARLLKRSDSPQPNGNADSPLNPRLMFLPSCSDSSQLRVPAALSKAAVFMAGVGGQRREREGETIFQVMEGSCLCVRFRFSSIFRLRTYTHLVQEKMDQKTAGSVFLRGLGQGQTSLCTPPA